MKISSTINGTPDTLTYGRVGRGSTGSSLPTSSGRAVTLETSDFLSELQAASKKHPYGEVRAEKVAEARADLESGRLGTDDDFEAAINALLREL